MSPFTAYSQCQAALVMLRFWKETGEEVYRERMEVLRVVLGSFGRRWVGAGELFHLLLSGLNFERMWKGGLGV